MKHRERPLSPLLMGNLHLIMRQQHLTVLFVMRANARWSGSMRLI